jgi:hypothetical protein
VVGAPGWHPRGLPGEVFLLDDIWRKRPPQQRITLPLNREENPAVDGFGLTVVR